MRPSVLKHTAGAALLLSCFFDLALARKCGPVRNTSTLEASVTVTSSVDTAVPSASSSGDAVTPTSSSSSSSVVEVATSSSDVETSSTSDSVVVSSTTDSVVVPSTTDSPPLNTDTVTFPDNTDWMATYTYYDAVELPTFTSTEIDIPHPTATPFCMLDPMETPDASFNLLDLQSGFIVSRDNRPGTPAPPESEEEAEELLANIENWQPPLFKFEKPAGAPEGVYDLVLEDDTGKHYVSLGADGTVSFVDQSSASTTTIFAVNCKGHLTVRKGGDSYTWRVADTGFTTVTAGETEDGIAVLRPNLSKALETAGSSEPELSRMRRLIRREDGWMPRCPARGSNIFAQARPNRRGENPNGCGSNNGMGKFVPNLNWGHCCNDHDNCYDNCGKSFQGCNNEFLGCMYNQCRADVKWWNWWMFPGCIATANFYWVFVSSPLGVDAFYTANKERCVCPCPNPAMQDMCLLNNNEVECRVVRTNDNNNCGGCDWRCPYKTHCSSGRCACDDQQCGNTCLNLSNNPRNCGACGNVCASGFCYQGRCYEPPEEPDVCIPGEAFRNGHFTNGNSTGWSTVPNPNTGQMDLDVSFGVRDPQNTASDPYIVQVIPSDAMVANPFGAHAVDLVTELRVCPGVAYDMHMLMRLSTGWGSIVCLPGFMIGGQGVATTYGAPSQQEAAGVAQINNNGQIGPFQVGQAGTRTVNKVYLGVEFRMRVVCSGLRFTDIEKMPTSFWGFTMVPV